MVISSKAALTKLNKISVRLQHLLQAQQAPEFFNGLPGGGPGYEILARSPARRTR